MLACSLARAHPHRSCAKFLRVLAGPHREFAVASGRSLQRLFDHRPSDGVIYHKRNIRCSFRNEHASDIGIIIDRGVGERQVAIPHVSNASLPAPDHDVGWDLVAALTNPPRHPIDGRLRRGQPELSLACTRSRILAIIRRPAARAARSALNGDSARAISSALTNSRMPRWRGTRAGAAVVFPRAVRPADDDDILQRTQPLCQKCSEINNIDGKRQVYEEI